MNVPPCTTTRRPSEVASRALITLYTALRTTEYANPAAMSPSSAPSFWAWRTRDVMNTVQRVPRSTGRCACTAASRKRSKRTFMDHAMPLSSAPHPLEQASFNTMSSTAPSRSHTHFISCPPMSRMKSASGTSSRAARTWATVSTSPESRANAFFNSSSPYPVTHACATSTAGVPSWRRGRCFHRSTSIACAASTTLPAERS